MQKPLILMGSKLVGFTQIFIDQNSEQYKQLNESLLETLKGIQQSFGQLPEPVVEVVNMPSPTIVDTLDLLAHSLENSIRPLIQSMEKKMDIDLRTLERIQELTNKIEATKVTASKTTRTRKATKAKSGRKNKKISYKE